MNEIENAISTIRYFQELIVDYEIREGIEDLIDSIDLAIEALKKILNGGWIPASERLPIIRECQENDCRFIVTDGNRRYQVWFDYEEGYFQKCECNGLGLKKDKCVIAWQPLPEEYRETK